MRFLSNRLIRFAIIFAIFAGIRYFNLQNHPGSASTPPTSTTTEASVDLATARKGFITKLTKQLQENSPPENPPAGVLDITDYPTESGSCAAYVSPAKTDGIKHPAIIWLIGGFSNSISSVAWSDYPADNDQSGKAFREAGIVEMYPSLRGGNANPGSKERFYGEVNDVLSARKYLASRADVDPNRIYLGGHSTGGTLALLVSEDSDLFRAVFSFGPVSDPRDYGADDLNYDVNDDQEAGLRAPGRWLNGIKKPTFILEGTAKRSNIDELELMRGSSTNPLVHFCPIPNKTHFSTLAPTTQLIAQKILQDNGPQCNITFTDQELVFP